MYYFVPFSRISPILTSYKFLFSRQFLRTYLWADPRDWVLWGAAIAPTHRDFVSSGGILVVA